MPDANSISTFREALTRARIGGVPAIQALFRRSEVMLSAAGYIAMGGQIVDATVVAAPKQRNTEDEKRALREGRIPEAWASKPARLAQKDRDALWTVKYSKQSRRRTARSAWTSPSRCSATRTMSASTAATG